MLHAMAEHAPKSLIASTVKEEGKLSSRTEAKVLTEHIWGTRTSGTSCSR